MSRRLVAAGFLIILMTVHAGIRLGAARPLQIFFIDVEGGQSTLLVTPAGESLLIDAGYATRRGRGGVPAVPEGRDAGRILDAARQAGIERIDYFLATHFHPDHIGGIPELAARIPIGTFIDYGEPLGTDRLTTFSFANYEPVRAAHPHIVVKPGDRLPLEGLDAEVVSAGGALLSTPVGTGGARNPACMNLEDHPEDGTENYRSVGVLFTYGAFRFLDLGDLSGNTLTRIACPRNLVGQVSAYLVSHHGDYDTTIPALYAALRPRVAIMNNGVTRGGDPEQFRTIHAQPYIEDLWQLHFSRNPGADNRPDAFIANVDDGTQTSYALTLTALDDGSFSVTNTRTAFTRTYAATPSHTTARDGSPRTDAARAARKGATKNTTKKSEK